MSSEYNKKLYACFKLCVRYPAVSSDQQQHPLTAQTTARPDEPWLPAEAEAVLVQFSWATSDLWLIQQNRFY